MVRAKTYDATGVAPNGRLFAGDLNLLQDLVAALTDLAQNLSVGTIAVGESGLLISRFGAGEFSFTGLARFSGIVRALAGLVGGTYTTTTRNAIALGSRPYGLIILNTTTNQYEWNKGTDAVPDWQPIAPVLGAGSITSSMILDGTIVDIDLAAATITARVLAPNSVTVAKLGTVIPDPMLALSMMMCEGVLPYPGNTSGNPQTGALAPSLGSGGWNLALAAGRALIQGDDATNQGMYLVTFQGVTQFTLPVGSGGLANPRLDVIAIQFNDQEDAFTARNPAGISIIQVLGAPTAGATLANRNGAPALPASAVWISDYLVKVGDAGVVGAQIGDQRRLAGPGIWGEDNHRYRLGVDATGTLGVEIVV